MQISRAIPFEAGATSLALLALLAPSASAQKTLKKAPAPAPATVQVTGEVVDLWCYVDHGGHGAKHRNCAVACVEAGNPIGIVDDTGKVYLAMGAKKHQPGREPLIDHMADHVMVTGRIVPMGSTPVLYVESLVELAGYSPVAYKTVGKAIQGKPGISATHEGKLYYFAKPKAREAFLKDPASFVPALAGDCIVCKVKAHEKIAGDPRIFSVYKGRTYLFRGPDQKKAFDAHPENFLKLRDS